MGSRLRTGIILAIIGIGLLIIGVFLVSGLYQQTIGANAQPTPIPIVSESVVVTTHDITLGTMLKSNDVAVIEIPVEFVPRDAVTNVEDVFDKYIKTDLVQGEMILQHNLADPTNVNRDLAFILRDDHVLMAFPAADLMSRESIIQRGDIIDIFVSITQTIDETGGGR